MKSAIAILVTLLSVQGFAQSLSKYEQNPCNFRTQALDQVTSGYLPPTSNDILVQSLGLSPQDRLQIMCDLKSGFLQKYASYYLKKDTAGIDLEKNFNLCAWREYETKDTSRLHFSDRVLECLAKTRDTHVYGALAAPRPAVATVFTMAHIQGKNYITVLNQRLIARLKQGNDEVPPDIDEILAVGNEVLEIDGMSVDQAALNLRRYISSSSLDYAIYASYASLTMRDFSYPTSSVVEFKIKKPTGEVRQVALPWWSYFVGPDIEAEQYFRNLGIPKVNDLQWVYDPAAHRYLKDDDAFGSKGWGFSIPLYSGKDINVLLGSSGSPAIRFGITTSDKGQKFCYLQIRTFLEKDLISATDDSVRTTFVDALKASVLTCKKENVPMVLDLRSNPGGIGDYPPYFMSLLARTGESTVGVAQTLRVDKMSSQVMNELLNPDRVAFTDLDNPSAFSSTALEAYKNALRNNQPYMDWIYGKDLAPDSDINGYNGKIVALVTPACVSACDITSRLLKNSKRATLLGTHANGTGAGFMGGESFLKDSLGILNVEIPNFLFSIPAAKSDITVMDFSANKSMVIENNPTMADVNYEPSLTDITQGNKDLKAKIYSILFQ